ncbi:MAG: HmuY family protein [Archangium sp.]
MNTRLLIFAAFVALSACGQMPPNPDSGVTGGGAGGGSGGTGGGSGVDAGPEVCSAVPVTCSDEAAAALSYKANLATGAITEEGTTAGEFTTYIDATGGSTGLSAPTMSYTYAKFTAAGLQRVDLSDEAAELDTTWDIAFRRYHVRLNSGVSGPSCVQGARTAAGSTFESVTTVDASLNFSSERYFTESCSVIDDGTGIGSPAYVLSSFWTYPGCVKMTGNVFVVKLADGRHVKLEVKSYYSLANQQKCQTMNSVDSPSGAGALRVRWAFLP